MALQLTTSPEATPQERQLLSRLLGLYETQQRLYGEVLTLSRRQRDLVSAGAPLGEIRTLLEAKKARLEAISRLDTNEATTRSAWRQGRRQWTVNGRTQLHQALTAVGRTIEDILACEEENDRELMQHCR
jgi:hypothetical protein